MTYKHITVQAKPYPLECIIDDSTETSKAISAELALANSAPDLLDALYLALPFVEDHEGDTGYKPGAVAKAIKTIRAAIAKATSTN